MLVLAIPMPVTRIEEKAVKTTETVKAVEIAKTGKDGKGNKDEYPKNLIPV